MRRTRGGVAMLGLLALLVLAACRAERPPAEAQPCDPALPATTATLVDASGVSSGVLTVELADTPADRQRGLSGRGSLDDGCGMLFRYPDEVRNAFWMRGMQFPLDIAFADADGRITAITTLEPCAADPCPRWTPERAYRMALEVPAGLLDELGVVAGDRIVVGRP